MKFFRHGDTMVSVDHLRTVQIVRSSPAGGRPYNDSAVLTFADGQRESVSVEFSEALMAALKTQTVVK